MKTLRLLFALFQHIPDIGKSNFPFLGNKNRKALLFSPGKTVSESSYLECFGISTAVPELISYI